MMFKKFMIICVLMFCTTNRSFLYGGEDEEREYEEIFLKMFLHKLPEEIQSYIGMFCYGDNAEKKVEHEIKYKKIERAGRDIGTPIKREYYFNVTGKPYVLAIDDQDRVYVLCEREERCSRMLQAFGHHSEATFDNRAFEKITSITIISNSAYSKLTIIFKKNIVQNSGGIGLPFWSFVICDSACDAINELSTLKTVSIGPLLSRLNQYISTASLEDSIVVDLPKPKNFLEQYFRARGVCIHITPQISLEDLKRMMNEK